MKLEQKQIVRLFSPSLYHYNSFLILNWRSNPAPDKHFCTCGLPRVLTKRELGEMMNVSIFHQSTKNRLMEEYLIYFHFRLMHHRIVPRLAIPASRWDWHVPENGRNCWGWSSFQMCVVSDPMSLFTTTIVLPSCSVTISRSSNFGQIWKFPNFLMTPPLRMCNRHNWRPDLQFSWDWQDFEESDRFIHGIWEINFNLDVTLKLVVLHQAKVHFPGKLAIWDPKNGCVQFDELHRFLAILCVILCERSYPRVF